MLDVLIALGTLGALVISIVTLRREIDFRRREQASRVWVASQYREQLDAWVGELRNASDQPIYDVHLRLRARSDPDTLLDEKYLTMLLPGDEATVTSDDGEARVEYEGIGAGKCVATFRDSSGVLFERAEAGSLREINEKRLQRVRELRAHLVRNRRRAR